MVPCLPDFPNYVYIIFIIIVILSFGDIFFFKKCQIDKSECFGTKKKKKKKNVNTFF